MSKWEFLRNETFFLDDNISGQAVARMLLYEGLRALVLTQVFVERSGVQDDEWLEYVGRKRWIAITSDRRILRENAHFLSNSEVRLFVIRFKYHNGQLLADKLRDRLDQISSRCRGRPPFAYEMRANGMTRVNLRKFP